jgi:hypothetical protein
MATSDLVTSARHQVMCMYFPGFCLFMTMFLIIGLMYLVCIKIKSIFFFDQNSVPRNPFVTKRKCGHFYVNKANAG